MSNRVNKNTGLGILISEVVILVAAVNLLLTLLFNGFYFDLTTENRYSLSQKTTDFLAQNKMPVHIRFYVGKDLHEKNQVWGVYADYLHKLLLEYQAKSNGLINLSFVEVTPFTSTQAEAEKAGIKELDFGDGSRDVYLGASFTNGNGKTLSIAQFFPERQKTVEDDISRLLSVLTSGKEVTIGIMSPAIRVAETGNPLDYKKDSFAVQQLKNSGYKIAVLSENTPFIPRYIDAVVLVYPLDLNPMALFALNQYLLRGGRVMILTDNFAEEKFRGKEEYIEYRSGLNQLMQSVGIDYKENILVGDNVNSRTLVLEGRKVQYPLWLTVNQSQMAQHLVMQGLKKLYLNHAGFFKTQPVEGLKITELFASGEDSGIIGADIVANLGYENLLKNYVVMTEKYSLALLMEGKFAPLFERPIVTNVELLQNMPPFLTVPIAEGKLILVADSDMFLAASKNNTTENDNLRFIRNAVDYLSGSGFIGVDAKETSLSKGNLSSMFYQLASNSYNEQRRQAAAELIEAKQRLIWAQDQKNKGLTSVKQAKEIEQLQRHLIDKEQALRRISYLIKQRFDHILAAFAFVMMFGLPLIAVLVAAFVYRLYNRRLKHQMEKYIHE